MSINHFSPDLPNTLWWTQHHIMDPNTTTNNTSSISKQQQQHQHQREAASWSSHHQQQQQLYHSQVWLNSQQSASMLIRSPNPSHTFNLNHNNVGDDDEVLETTQDNNNKEAMFEKPLTPSDVGKLNRLVIPKQHAEKYFPLGGDSGDKGLLLSFEDESGKCWRFRYSYWNSSQSYVLTKGWSRYVKEKQLDAGDVVLFERHRTDADRFFICWRRRSSAPQQETVAQPSNSTVSPGGEQWTRVYYSAHPYPTHPGHAHGPPVPYQPDCIHAGNGSIVPTTVPAGNLKRLRLFGVNLECQLDDSEPSTPDGSSSVSSQGATHYNHNHHYYSNHMDRSFSGDMNQQQQMRNERG